MHRNLISGLFPIVLALASSLLAVGRPEGGGDERDQIVLKSGKTIRCRVVLELDKKVAILRNTRERWIDRSKIAEIVSLPRSMRKILDAFDKGGDAPEELMALAEQCDKASLPHEAQLFRWKTILAKPDHAGAHQALGHKQFGGEWRIPIGTGWKDLPAVEKIRAEWGKAWRLRSEHYEIRTNAGLQQGVETLLQLESFYRRMFELFQQPLELREVTEPIQVHLYRDGKAFPRLSNNVDAYFSRLDNILFTFVDDTGAPLTLFHQATHATIFNLGGSSKGRRTELPGWLNEGWADYLEGVLIPGKGGRVALDVTRRLGYRIGNLPAEKSLYSLRRVLNLRETDFSASSKQKLKYAQSYALTLYMLEGEGGAFTERFLAYMKRALIGKASSSQFRSVFRKDLKKIEAGYIKMK